MLARYKEHVCIRQCLKKIQKDVFSVSCGDAPSRSGSSKARSSLGDLLGLVTIVPSLL